MQFRRVDYNCVTLLAGKQICYNHTHVTPLFVRYSFFFLKQKNQKTTYIICEVF